MCCQYKFAPLSENYCLCCSCLNYVIRFIFNTNHFRKRAYMSFCRHLKYSSLTTCKINKVAKSLLFTCILSLKWSFVNLAGSITSCFFLCISCLTRFTDLWSKYKFSQRACHTTFGFVGRVCILSQYQVHFVTV